MKRNPRVCMSGHNTNEEVELKGIVWYATHNWPRSPIVAHEGSGEAASGESMARRRGGKKRGGDTGT